MGERDRSYCQEFCRDLWTVQGLYYWYCRTVCDSSLSCGSGLEVPNEKEKQTVIMWCNGCLHPSAGAPIIIWEGVDESTSLTQSSSHGNKACKKNTLQSYFHPSPGQDVQMEAIPVTCLHHYQNGGVCGLALKLGHF